VFLRVLARGKCGQGISAIGLARIDALRADKNELTRHIALRRQELEAFEKWATGSVAGNDRVPHGFAHRIGDTLDHRAATANGREAGHAASRTRRAQGIVGRRTLRDEAERKAPVPSLQYRCPACRFVTPRDVGSTRRSVVALGGLMAACVEISALAAGSAIQLHVVHAGGEIRQRISVGVSTRVFIDR